MELVKISQVQVGEKNVNAVNARELWKALESKQQFADWIKTRIEKLGLVESRDYGIFHNVMKNVEGGVGRPITEYVITIDIAKHLAMIEMTDKGHQVREYFIECEKQLAQSFKTPTNMIEALELALEQAKQIEAQKQTIEHQHQVIEYQGGKLENFTSVERTRRSRQELSTKLNKTIRLLAEQKFNKDYGKAYTYIYGEFAKLHCIPDKVNMDYLKKNIDYLAECLAIATTELD